MPEPGFAPATAAWFASAFAAPTAAQSGAWATTGDTLVVAPTGSGKTLAAFLQAVDRLTREPLPADPLRRTRVLYISPLKALAVDVERNLRSPLAGIRREAGRLGVEVPDVTVGIRTGDTSPDDRRRQLRTPPDILITTPESLFLLLTSRARDTLGAVHTVIVDEVHAVAGTKRGAHLAVSLARLDSLLPERPRRIGLSATVRPVDEVALFLAGPGRPVEVVQPPSDKVIEISVQVPVDDMAALGEPTGDVSGSAAGAEERTSIWPHVERHVVDLVAGHRATIVFANSRRLAERLTARLNEEWAERCGDEAAHAVGVSSAPAAVLARAHHGSVSREQRAVIEDDLKAGRLPAVVATSSLELGIDMGAVDLVVQVESPPSVASGLQRIGRAGHQVGAVSRGVVLPKFRGDLLQAAVASERMSAGAIEAVRAPRTPLDVLAQQVVAMVAMDDWGVDDLLDLLRGTAPFATLTPAVLGSVLDMLSGLYPGDEFAELRPRLVWDRESGVLRGRPGAQRLAVTSGGTIPDRGLFGVFLVGERAPADASDRGRRSSMRVGELDEEMVYESRVGDVFALGASSWRIEDITHDRVLVSPAPGVPARMPFWHGDAIGRPYELGAALGAFLRELGEGSKERLEALGLDERAVSNLLAYVAEQRAATGVLPDDRTIVVERFRDELGDWRVVVHSPFGARVHAPWALVVAARMRERFGLDAAVMHADDGIVLRLPDTDDDAAIADAIAEALPSADEVEALVTSEVGGSALFAARFRECAARALLLPRRRPDRRTPLWQQRQRSAQLLAVASKYPSFPIVLETVREVLQDVYDVPALVSLLRRVESREVRVVEVETQRPSPFAQSLLFGYVASFLYEGDAPLAERRAQALTLDTALLAELLGEAELRDLLDERAIESIERDLARLGPDHALRHADDLADLLRLLGPLGRDDVVARAGREAWLDDLVSARRAFELRRGDSVRWAAVEDAARLRDALGVALPPGLPDAFLEPVADPLGDLVARFARTHGPFTAAQVAEELGLGVAVARGVLERLAAEGRVVPGEFRPGGAGAEWCDTGVLRRIRRASAAALRQEAEPVPVVALARFLPAWQSVEGRSSRPGQSVGSRRSGADGLLAVVDQLAGAAIPASALETLVLPARVQGYSPALLDTLTSSGEVVWWGLGALPGGDGLVALAPADAAPALLPVPAAPDDPLVAALVEATAGGGGWFFRDLSNRVGAAVGVVDDPDLVAALWRAVWVGLLTNDTIGPLRSVLGGGGRAPRGRGPRMPTRTGPPSASGRWSGVPRVETDPTLRAAAQASRLLERHGVLTRGAVAAERVPGGFAAAYRVLAAFEDSGRARRAYAVEGLGAAQFALPGAVDRLRAIAREEPVGASVLLAAADPANAYGAALPWPVSPGEAGHRPGRKAGAAVVLVDGGLALYLERGGKSLLTFTDDPAVLREAAERLAREGKDGRLGRLAVERIDGASAGGSALAPLLVEAGFVSTPRGLRLRG